MKAGFIMGSGIRYMPATWSMQGSTTHTISAMPRARTARLRMQAANIGADVIDGAAARLRIEIDAIATGAPREGVEALLVIEMINQTIFE